MIPSYLKAVFKEYPGNGYRKGEFYGIIKSRSYFKNLYAKQAIFAGTMRSVIHCPKRRIYRGLRQKRLRKIDTFKYPRRAGSSHTRNGFHRWH